MIFVQIEASRLNKGDKMKIFQEGDKVHLQLMDLAENKMLFNFSIEKEAYNVLKDHIIEHLNKFQVKE